MRPSQPIGGGRCLGMQPPDGLGCHIHLAASDRPGGNHEADRIAHIKGIRARAPARRLQQQYGQFRRPYASAFGQIIVIIERGQIARPSRAAGCQVRAPECTPNCRASTLTLRYGPDLVPISGEHADFYALVNHGRTACTLEGYPAVALYDARGALLPFRYVHRGSMYVTKAAPRTVLLPPGATAYVLVAKYRCDLGIIRTAATIRLTLPGTPRTAMAIRIAPGRPARSASPTAKAAPTTPDRQSEYHRSSQHQQMPCRSQASRTSGQRYRTAAIPTRPACAHWSLRRPTPSRSGHLRDGPQPTPHEVEPAVLGTAAVELFERDDAQPGKSTVLGDSDRTG